MGVRRTSRFTAFHLLSAFLLCVPAAAQSLQGLKPESVKTAVPPQQQIPSGWRSVRTATTSSRDVRNKYDLGQIGHRRVDQGMNFYSRQAEKTLGRTLAALVEPHLQLITDVPVNRYMNQLGQKIASRSDAIEPVTIKIVSDPEPNAYSLPGGVIYIDSGLILATENEAQLAAALAHETAHVAARHFTRLFSKKRLWQWSSWLTAGPAGYLFQRTAMSLLLLKSARQAEFEADLLGLEYQYAAGYDPREFIRLLANLDDPREQSPTRWDSVRDSHPLTEKRVAQAQLCIAHYLPSRPAEVVDTSDFQEMKERVASLMGAQSPTAITSSSEMSQ